MTFIGPAELSDDIFVFNITAFLLLIFVCQSSQFYCKKDNEYNDLATIFFNTQVFSCTIFSKHYFSISTLLYF